MSGSGVLSRQRRRPPVGNTNQTRISTSPAIHRLTEACSRSIDALIFHIDVSNDDGDTKNAGSHMSSPPLPKTSPNSIAGDFARSQLSLHPIHQTSSILTILTRLGNRPDLRATQKIHFERQFHQFKHVAMASHGKMAASIDALLLLLLLPLDTYRSKQASTAPGSGYRSTEHFSTIHPSLALNSGQNLFVSIWW